MEEPGGPRFEGLGNTMRKKRSQNSRRPRLESLPFPETCDQSPLSSTPPSDDVSKTSSEENTRFDTNSRRKEFNLNLCTLNGSAIKAGEYPLKKIKEDRSHSLSYGDRDFGDSDDQGGNGLNHQRCSEGALAPANWKTTTKMKGSFELQSTTRNSKHGEILENFVSSRSSKDSKKSRSERGSDDTDYEEDEEIGSDGEPEGKKKKKKLRKDSIDSAIEIRKELALTNRQRALLSSKDASSASGASIIEFPNGLPPAPPRKQKEQLSELEQQLKKAEAAQRRRLQVEKAARESEAEAIRKILGQDSSRKKREDKLKKRREELEQERAASARTLASNTIRWVIGPSSTVVTFSNDMGLPSIFNPKPCSYPPPRERCAGPSCTNPYKYRDSKSKLPLCSLQCYKAMHEKMDAETSS
ncbi:hypothetical protein CsSME_00047463 [Camellia sinensis var. sinensis]